MTDEIKLHQDMQRGARADELLRNELLNEAFTTLEADYIKAWAGSLPEQTIGRENLWRAVQVLGDVRRHLMIVARDGRIAVAEINQIAAQNIAAQNSK